MYLHLILLTNMKNDQIIYIHCASSAYMQPFGTPNKKHESIG